MNKRIFAMLLALLMLGSLFPASALAEGEIVMDPVLWEPDGVLGPPAEGPDAPVIPEETPAEPAEEPAGDDAPGVPVILSEESEANEAEGSFPDEAAPAPEAQTAPEQPTEEPAGDDAPGVPEIPEARQEADEAALSNSGQCGSSLYWELYDGTLSISGSGEMWDYNSDDPGWYPARDSILRVSIGDGVSSIGSYAFWGCYNLETVMIPSSVDSIGSYAFSNCSSLTEMSFLGNAPSFGVNCFYDVNKLTVYLSYDDDNTWTDEVMQDYGGSVTWVWGGPNSGQIGPNLYWELSGGVLTVSGSGDMWNYGTGMPGWYPTRERVKRVVLGPGVTSIGDAVFTACYQLSIFTVPESVLYFGDLCFSYCTFLEEVIFLGSAPSFCSECFYGDNSIKAYYPADNPSWNEWERQDYGGSVTWVPYPMAAPTLSLARASGGVSLSWNAVPNAPRYNIYRKVGNGNWAWLAASTGTGYTDTTAAPGSAYSYRMAVVSSDGRTMLGSMSAEKSITLFPAPALSVAKVSGGVKLSWNSIPNAPRYNLYRKVGNGNWAWLAASTGTSYTDTKVASGTSYTYRMAVVSADGKSLLSPMSAEKSITYSVFAAPVITLTNVSGGVQVTWNSVPGAPRYNIYRKVGSGGWSWLAASTGTGYTDTKVSSGTTYSYRMAVVSSDGKSLLSPMGAEKSITRSLYAAPVISSVANVAGGVQIKWSAVPDAPRYNLYRKVGNGNWAWLAASTGTSYTDSKTVSGTKYSYRMAVVSSDGKSLLSPMGGEKSITWFAPPAITLSNAAGGIQIKWTAVSGAPRYNIYRKVGTGSWAWLAASTGTSYVDTKVSSGTTYTYRMAVVSADGKTMLSAMGGEKSLTR